MIDEWGKGAKYWDKAWNPVIGCRKVSEGCANCYAERMAARFPELQDGHGGFMPHFPKKLKSPPKTGVVFVGNMTDIFGVWNGNYTIYNWLYSLSKEAINLVLTKRGERIDDFLDWEEINDRPLIEFSGEHIWLGVTAENQCSLEKRTYDLSFWHGKRWLSAEPLLERIDLEVCSVDGGYTPVIQTLNWVVVGAESGDKRRPCSLDWVRQIVRQCQAANVPVFVKQLDIDGKLVSDINQFPEDLQIRQVPWMVK